MNEITLWKDKKNKKLDPKLFSCDAEKMAILIGDEGKTDDSGVKVKENKYRNKTSQLRRYFDEVVRLNSLARLNDEDWDMILPQVHMLVAKVVFACGRKLVTESFVKMMNSGINQIEERDDLRVFTNFMESFIGFYKIHGPK